MALKLKIGKLNARIKSSELRKLHGAKAKKNTRTPDPIEISPHLAIGRYVEKRFNHKWHIGIVTEWGEDADNYCNIWRVEYEDGDFEDCSWKELECVLCPTEEEPYMRSIIDPYECAPSMALQKPVGKIYNGTMYFGVVTGYDVDMANEQMWQVQYNDGDISDYNIKELRRILLN